MEEVKHGTSAVVFPAWPWALVTHNHNKRKGASFSCSLYICAYHYPLFFSPARPDLSEAHPSPCSVITGSSFPAGKAAGSWSWPFTSCRLPSLSIQRTTYISLRSLSHFPTQPSTHGSPPLYLFSLTHSLKHTHTHTHTHTQNQSMIIRSLHTHTNTFISRSIYFPSTMPLVPPGQWGPNGILYILLKDVLYEKFN